jgi:cephalosporin-C deacetylase-like acetyl esterase
MPREDIEFQTNDHVTLRGWFYKPDSPTSSKLPCLVMSHGFSALKEMELDTFAAYFTANLPLSCLVYDNRGFGSSDVKDGQPRQEIIPDVQCSDISDAITYSQSRTDVDAEKVGIWGSSYAGGNVLWVGAVDKRVKAVLSQIPMANGYDSFHRVIRPDFIVGLNAMFQGGNIAVSIGSTSER